VGRSHAATRGPWLAAVATAALVIARAGSASSAPAAPPLTQVSDEHQLAELAQAIAQDPAVAVDDPAARPVVQALIIEGVKQLHARGFDQALANFLEAYAKLPSPKLLLAIGAILRDMGRLADAANTYHRYLVDPSAGADRVTDVAELLSQLDEQLTILTVHVPRGAQVSLDDGPFVEVGGELVTRVTAGSHRVQLRVDQATSQAKITAGEGEAKEVTPQPPAGAHAAAPSTELPDRVDGWLVTGTAYGADRAISRARTVYDADGRAIAAVLPHRDTLDEPSSERAESGFEYGAVGVARIDGEGRGFAGGLGITVARGRWSAELMLLKSDQYGGYLGLRYQLLGGRFRPYLATGIPGFAFHHDELQADATMMGTRRLAVGGRVAAGLELEITEHLSLHADAGYEHFFFLDGQYQADLFVPTLGVIGWL
jgi:hypothetical protein